MQSCGEKTTSDGCSPNLLLFITGMLSVEFLLAEFNSKMINEEGRRWHSRSSVIQEKERGYEKNGTLIISQPWLIS